MAIGEAFAGYVSWRKRSVDLLVDPTGTTMFTRAAPRAASGIPFASVGMYGAIAATIGQPSTSRAVGDALGRNPVPLIIPCHRVIRSALTAGGFVGGAAIREHLLQLERADARITG